MANNLRGFFTGLNTFFSGPQSKAVRDAYGYAANSYNRADVVYAASTAFTTIADLGLELAPGAYRLTYILPLPATTAAGNLKVQLLSGNGLTINNLRLTANFFLTGVAPASTAITALSSAVNGGTTNAWTHCLITGTIDVKDGGWILFQAAQQAASGATTVGLGACVDAQQLTVNK